VLYDALDLPGLRRQGVTTDHVLIFSGLWGCSGPVTGSRTTAASGGELPAVGSVSAAWRKALRDPLAALRRRPTGGDLRSGAAGIGAAATQADEFADLVRELGYTVERAPSQAARTPRRHWTSWYAINPSSPRSR